MTVSDNELKLMTTAPPANAACEKNIISAPPPATIVSPPTTVPAPPTDPVLAPTSRKSVPGPATRLTLPCAANSESFVAEPAALTVSPPAGEPLATRNAPGAPATVFTYVASVPSTPNTEAAASPPYTVALPAPPMNATYSALALAALMTVLPAMLPVPMKAYKPPVPALMVALEPPVTATSESAPPWTNSEPLSAAMLLNPPNASAPVAAALDASMVVLLFRPNTFAFAAPMLALSVPDPVSLP